MKIILKNSSIRFDSYLRGWRSVDLSQLPVIDKVINAQGSWESIGYSYLIQRNTFDTKVKIKASSAGKNAYSFLTGNSTTGAVQFCDGISGRFILQADQEVEVDIPSDCTYLYVTNGFSQAGDSMPQSYMIYG